MTDALETLRPSLLYHYEYESFKRDFMKQPFSIALYFIENDAEIFPVHYTWKVAEKGFKIAFMMNILAMIIYFEIFLEK